MNLTDEQVRSIQEGEPVAVLSAEVGTECVVLRRDVYERIQHQVYDDRPLTDEEQTRLGWESGKNLGWESPEMAEYDHYGEKP